MSAVIANPPVALLELYTDYLLLKHPLDVLSSKDPWRTACGLVLAAHCSDAAVNKITSGFFKQYPKFGSVLVKTRDDLIPLLPGISHSGNKSDYIINWANYMAAHEGDMETTITALTQVKGVGRKTAGILLYTVKGIDEALPLDTHALRILDRLGWFPATKNSEVREKQMLPLIPEGRRFATFTILTQHGRWVCGAKSPQCEVCKLKDSCQFAQQQAVQRGQSPRNPLRDALRLGPCATT
jgi:endonuclease III